jgi:hypothetical protein
MGSKPAHPEYYMMGTGLFRVVKRQRRGVDHPPLSSAEVKEIVELYLCSSSRSSRVTFTSTVQFLYLDAWKVFKECGEGGAGGRYAPGQCI